MDAARRILAHPPLIVALALVAGLVGGGVVVGARELTRSDDTPSGSTGPECDVERVAAATLPSVVTLQVTTAEGQGNGSGVVVETTPGRRYILTNEHVVGSGARGTDIRVVYSDGRTAVGHVVGADAVTDLAVVEGEPEAPPVRVGSSGELRIGQPVIAVGAPLGLSSTVTTGIVSATDRYVRVPSATGASHHLVGAIQTDASINPGNSGGALVNCTGDLVGINAAGASPPGDQGSVGLNFAIPSSLFTTIATELVDHGRVRHPTLGVQVATISVETAANTGRSTGLFVQAVAPGGPAEQAGLRGGRRHHGSGRTPGLGARRPCADRARVDDRASRRGHLRACRQAADRAGDPRARGLRPLRTRPGPERSDRSCSAHHHVRARAQPQRS